MIMIDKDDSLSLIFLWSGEVHKPESVPVSLVQVLPSMVYIAVAFRPSKGYIIIPGLTTSTIQCM